MGEERERGMEGEERKWREESVVRERMQHLKANYHYIYMYPQIQSILLYIP